MACYYWIFLLFQFILIYLHSLSITFNILLIMKYLSYCVPSFDFLFHCLSLSTCDVLFVVYNCITFLNFIVIVIVIFIVILIVIVAVAVAVDIFVIGILFTIVVDDIVVVFVIVVTIIIIVNFTIIWFLSLSMIILLYFMYHCLLSVCLCFLSFSFRNSVKRFYLY